MRLPWLRPNKAKSEQAVEEARKARQKAERDLAHTRAETPKYRDLGKRLKDLRERNHLREAFEASFRGGSGV